MSFFQAFAAHQGPVVDLFYLLHFRDWSRFRYLRKDLLAVCKSLEGNAQLYPYALDMFQRERSSSLYKSRLDQPWILPIWYLLPIVRIFMSKTTGLLFPQELDSDSRFGSLLDKTIQFNTLIPNCCDLCLQIQPKISPKNRKGRWAWFIATVAFQRDDTDTSGYTYHYLPKSTESSVKSILLKVFRDYHPYYVELLNIFFQVVPELQSWEDTFCIAKASWRLTNVKAVWVLIYYWLICFGLESTIYVYSSSMYVGSIDARQAMLKML